MTTSLVRAAALAAMGISAVAGCATPGTRPHDMSVAGHEEAEAEAEAAARAARLQPPGSTGAACQEVPCWSDRDRPTDASRRLLAVAAKHRAAAQALREAEAQACAGISERDRGISPFFHREDVAVVAPLEEKQGRYGHRLAGATIEFRAVRGLTAEWLQRSADCHLARSAALGFDQSEMGFCPLALKGVAARVRSGREWLLVEVTSQDPATAREVWRRAQALVVTAR